MRHDSEIYISIRISGLREIERFYPLDKILGKAGFGRSCGLSGECIREVVRVFDAPTSPPKRSLDVPPRRVSECNRDFAPTIFLKCRQLQRFD